ncbi:MAG: hypothetical protein WAT77_14110 [Paracoccaceae bacterium]
MQLRAVHVIFLAGILALITLLLGVVPVFIFGAGFEASTAAYYRLFSTIANRSLQLSRYGSVSSPRYLEPGIDISAGTLENPRSIDCNSRVAAKDLDPRLFEANLTLIDSFDPLVVVFVYQGPPPDLSPFFTPDSAMLLLGDQGFWNIEGAEINQKNVVIGGVLSEYNKLIKDRKFQWKSVRCSNFTFTKILEIENGE